MTPDLRPLAVAKGAVLSGVDSTESYEVIWMNDESVEVPREESTQYVVNIFDLDGVIAGTVYGSGVWELEP